MSALAAAFLTNHRIVLRMLDLIPADAWEDRYAARVRTVADQFIHLHHVRRMWLEVCAPAQAKALSRFAQDSLPSPAELRTALDASAAALADALREGEEKGKIKGVKHSPAQFMAYVVSHEAYHRALISVSLKQNGHGLSQEAKYGLWEWDKI